MRSLGWNREDFFCFGIVFAFYLLGKHEIFYLEGAVKQE